MSVAFADVEALLVTWLAGKFPSARLCTETPANLGDVLPAIRVQRFGGSDRDVNLDDANVAVDVFAASSGAALVLAEQVRSALRFTLPGQVVGAAVVARVTTIAGPVWLPWDNTSLRRFGASYQLTTQSREATTP